MRFTASIFAAALLAAGAVRADPDCAGMNHWPASMTLARLKNAGLLSPAEIDFDRSTSALIASQRIGPNRWRQVFKVEFVRRTGPALAAIAVSDASTDECSMGEVTVYRLAAPPTR